MSELDTLINKVHCMDALALMKLLPDASVDAVITDLPYGTTACSWDEIIPFEPMWAGVKRVLKRRGVFVTTSSQPFTSKLVMSNLMDFKYQWIWVKNKSSGFANAHKQPLRSFEDVLVFAGNTFYPQGIRKINMMRKNGRSVGGGTLRGELLGGVNKGNLRSMGSTYIQEFTNYPCNVLFFNTESQTSHSTQKPVELYKYLIRTYTQPGELILDFCCGSGTTAVAAKTLNRHFIAGDTDAGYCAIARKRLETVTQDMFEVYGGFKSETQS